MSEEVTKEIDYKGKTYNFVNPCIKQSQRTQVFLFKMLDYADNFSKDERINLLMVTDKVAEKLKEFEMSTQAVSDVISNVNNIKSLVENKDKEEADRQIAELQNELSQSSLEYKEMLYEFIDAYNRLNLKMDAGIRLFLQDNNELADFLELCFGEQAKEIDVNVESDEDAMELEAFKDLTLKRFFFFVKKRMKR